MSDDKALTVILVAFFMGFVGSLVVGWPAMACAAVSIVAISFSKEKS